MTLMCIYREGLSTLKESFSTQVQQAKQRCVEFSCKTTSSQGNIISAIDALVKVTIR
jgi:hypothetical protein